MNSLDAIVIGAGHNGLVAANYLARAGLNVLALERRPIAGGLCATEEVFPGFRGNICANSAGSLEPKIILDLELLQHGLEFAGPDPYSLMAFPDGRAFVGWRDRARATDEVRKFSTRDVEPYYGLLADLSELARTLNVSFFEAPPSLEQLAGRIRCRSQRRLFDEVMFGSIRDLVECRLESPQLRAVLGALAIQGNFAGPSTPGTPYMLLHRPLSQASTPNLAQADGQIAGDGDVILATRKLRRGTQTPRGGMGAITQAMARALQAAGGRVRTDSCVARILIEGERAVGVVLNTGEEIRARVVLSNANPKYTLLDLVPPASLDAAFRASIEALDMTGVACKAILALDAMPRFAAARNDEENRAFAQCGFRMAPSLDMMEKAYAAARAGRWPAEPMLWGTILSAIDPELAPVGKHVMSLSVFPAPYTLAEGHWDTAKTHFGRAIVDTLRQYFTNFPDIVRDLRVITPLDFERDFGLTGGNPTHGDMLPARMFDARPVTGCSDYRTPIPGLYLCGSGTWPGGLVSGVPGHNAAQAVLCDLRATRRNPAGTYDRTGAI